MLAHQLIRSTAEQGPVAPFTWTPRCLPPWSAKRSPLVTSLPRGKFATLQACNGAAWSPRTARAASRATGVEWTALLVADDFTMSSGMRFFADLHIHSKYSRATSSDCDLAHLAYWARRKGIRVIGTGDFTHPAWMAELRDNLVRA